MSTAQRRRPAPSRWTAGRRFLTGAAAGAVAVPTALAVVAPGGGTSWAGAWIVAATGAAALGLAVLAFPLIRRACGMIAGGIAFACAVILGSAVLRR